MPDSVDTLVSQITDQGGFETTTAMALGWLNERHRDMCAVSRCFRDRIEIGPAVAGQEFYAVADVVETYNVEVGGVPYTKARRSDVYAYSQGALVWAGPSGSGFVVEDVNASNAQGFTLIPPPGSSGAAITIWAAVLPPDLVTGGAASTIKTDVDCNPGLVAGAIATGLLRVEQRPDLAAPHEQIYAAMVEKQRQRVMKRFRTAGPSQIRVVGINA